MSQLKYPSKDTVLKDLTSVLSYLTQKEYEVVTGRYGIGRDQSTLAAIGEDLSLTRERVRQIQVQAIKKLQRSIKSTDTYLLCDYLSDFIEMNGGLVTETTLADHLSKEIKDASSIMNHLFLIAELDSDVRHEHNKVNYEPHYRFKDIKMSQIKETCHLATQCLKSAKTILDKAVIFKYVSKNYSEEYKFSSEDSIFSILQIDRRLKDHGSKVSLLAWRHVNPRTLFDKIVYVLNKGNKPLHFRDISKAMEKEGLRPKNSSIQAIHNELIGNGTFVLIGRGTYALKDWGYEEGTVSDVIHNILSENGPLSLNDLTQEVLQRRKVKEVTVQINLNSKKDLFEKNEQGLYAIK